MDPNHLGAPPPESFSDTNLYLDAARGGDEQAYRDLFARFRPGLETLLAIEIGRTVGLALRNKLHAHAEDLLQETVIKGFAALHTIDYRGPGSVLAFFATILRNEVHNFRAYWTAERRNPGREHHAAGGEDDATRLTDRGVADPDRGPPSTLRITEERQRVADALARLSEDHRELLWMRFFGGASWAEIARRLGMPGPDAARMACRNKALPAFALAFQG